MKRSALSDFLRGVVVAALPLATAACCSERRQMVYEQVDAFVVDDMGIYVGEPLPTSVCADVCKTAYRGTVTQNHGCTVADATDGGITAVSCDDDVKSCAPIFGAGGRPPLGLKPRSESVARDVAGAFFASMAHVEAAAVAGFEELATALEAHGAPATLVDDARRAAADERRHARVAADFAERRGATPPPVEIAPVPPPSLETLALANAREGCVLETWGAVVTQWQGRMAADRVVRRAFINIARDELRHAELALAVAKWLAERLDDAALARVRAARDAAIAELEREIARPLPRAAVVELGLPDGEAACAMFAAMRSSIWRSA
jgi:hypothetical protein